LIGQYPPYIDERAENLGIMTEIVTKALEDQGIDYKMEFTSWTRVENSIDNEGIISFAYVKNKERLKKWYFSAPIIQAPSIFIKHYENDVEIETLNDLKKYKIGISRDYSYGEVFDKLKPMLEVEEVSTDLINMKKILHKRIDLFPLPLYNAIYYLRNNFSKEQRKKIEFIFYPPINDGNLHLVCNKKRPECINFIKAFNKGLSSVTKKGIRDRVISTYLTWQ
jgi:polar amino acid transport system substrate-binding protein